MSDKGTLTYDVHGHFMPEAAMDLMSEGQVVVTGGVGSESIAVNGMLVGATLHQLSSADYALEAMSSAGLHHRVLTPPPFTYRYWDDPQRGLQLCRLINDSTAATVAANPKHFSGLATVPLQDPRLAIDELKRSTEELGLSGLGVGTNVDGRLLSDPALRDFFAEVTEMHAPVLVHPDFVPSQRYTEYYLINCIGMPVETTTTLANMVLSGMIEDLPDLRICLLHGGGAAPYLMGRISHSWHSRPDTSRDSSTPPEDQLGSVYWDTLTHSPEALGFLVSQYGADHVVVGTDAPFDMEDADPLKTLSRAPGLSEEERHQIRSVTPLQWLYGPNR
ncbi:MAG: amidohydrolase [Acidimicrobiia bacterium]|nr:amidohydrolase [Acidimicrobiia bacterium]